jgi:hypothetical protein
MSGRGRRAAEAVLQITELIAGRLTLLLKPGQGSTLLNSTSAENFPDEFSSANMGQFDTQTEH